MVCKSTFIAAVAALGFLVCGTAVQAQERTAGNTNDLQMTWSSLKSMIDSAKSRTEVVNSRVDQVVFCGKKGLVYSPGIPEADGNGCVDPHSIGGVALTTVVNNMTKITEDLTSTTNTMNQIIGCNKAGKVFNGTTCVSAAPTGFTKVDMNACTFLPWLKTTVDYGCPANHVLAKVRTHRTDSAEWEGFWCCPLR